MPTHGNFGGPAATDYPGYANDRCISMPWMGLFTAKLLSRGYQPPFLLWMKRQGRIASTRIEAEQRSIPETIRAIEANSGASPIPGQQLGNYQPHNQSESLLFQAAAGTLRRMFRTGELFPSSDDTGIHPDLNPAAFAVDPWAVVPFGVDRVSQTKFTGGITCDHDCTLEDCIFDLSSMPTGIAIQAAAGSDPVIRLVRCHFIGGDVQVELNRVELYRCLFEGRVRAGVLAEVGTGPFLVQECSFKTDNQGFPGASPILSAIQVRKALPTTAGSEARIFDCTIESWDMQNGQVPIVALYFTPTNGAIEAISVRGCKIRGGTYAIRAEAASSQTRVKGLLLEDNYFDGGEAQGRWVSR